MNGYPTTIPHQKPFLNRLALVRRSWQFVSCRFLAVGGLFRGEYRVLLRCVFAHGEGEEEFLFLLYRLVIYYLVLQFLLRLRKTDP